MVVFENIINTSEISFRTCEEVRPLLKKTCAENSEVAEFQELGSSEQGRPIVAAILGNGPKTVSLIAGAHSDEPVGPEMLRTFIFQTLAQKDRFAMLFSEFKFIIVPHINPDGEAKNQAWIKKWPNIEDYLRYAFREPPGRDVEFGYPDMRKENKVVADFLKAHAPFTMHMSLHGMGFSDGGFLLIEKHWIDRTQKLREKYSQKIFDSGLKLHDHDRNGEKGFQYIGPGFTTTPEGQAMRAYFESIGDEQTVALFRDSSMEFVRKLGGDPLCLVTEIPLFYIGKDVPNSKAGVPAAYLEFKEKVPELKLKLAQGESIAAALNELEINPIDLKLQIKLQLRALELGLETIVN
ncbi:peptidase M14 [candidate division KSB1 bacterium]|nr:peptidase M14 [candidate division KSB1 bacterium]